MATADLSKMSLIIMLLYVLYQRVLLLSLYPDEPIVITTEMLQCVFTVNTVDKLQASCQRLAYLLRDMVYTITTLVPVL